MTVIALPEPSDIQRETRRLCMRFARLSIPTARPARSSASITHTSAVILELFVLTMGAMEAARELGLSTREALTRDADRWLQLTRDLTKLNVTRLIRDVKSLGVRVETADSTTHSVNRLDAIYGQIDELTNAILKFCPVDQLEAEAKRDGQLEIAHRIRCAHAMLTSMRLRNRDPQDHRFVVAGQAYAQGRLSAREVAQVMQSPIEDVVASLEECGFHRTTQQATLDDATRDRLLAQIRAMRLSASVPPMLDHRLVARDVIASQRIEGIDARPWMLLNPT